MAAVPGLEPHEIEWLRAEMVGARFTGDTGRRRSSGPRSRPTCLYHGDGAVPSESGGYYERVWVEGYWTE